MSNNRIPTEESANALRSELETALVAGNGVLMFTVDNTEETLDMRRHNMSIRDLAAITKTMLDTVYEKTNGNPAILHAMMQDVMIKSLAKRLADMVDAEPEVDRDDNTAH